MQLPSALFGLIPQDFLCFFLKRPALEKFFIYSQKSFSNFQKLELSYIFLKKKTFFLHFRKGIFRTPAYLELEVYSGPWYIQNPRHIQNTVKHLRLKVFQK